ncbi:putative chloroplast protein import component Tic20 [Medicago truncatula]|uniref:Protein TIC 20 n=1 Tax=Medicago truncatula TaxID=3880 RepID=A0A072VB93_MEDTR|nr:protein TIC 20-IV, chloroplastic [Medicago truncatula]KEH39067.1 TIC protein 20-IV, related protein [Medicago truncatula]RHN75674.1 putative chloroplast protein import component Tic20 [Medicago truncatula]
MMAGQLTASAATTTYASLLRLPSLPNKDLIQQRRVSFNGKRKNLAIAALAGSSLGKSATRLTAVSSPLFTDNHGHLSLGAPISRRSSSSTRPEAYIYHWSGFRIPANSEKPEWWWRTLSCIPYLIAMQMSAAGYYLEPLLDKYKLFENVIFYIPGAVNRLPTWFPILYCYLAIMVVVKNRDFPIIFRFHVMMGMLLEIALQIVWVASNFMPLIHFKGTLGMYYWAGVALAYIVIIMHSIRCALLGTFSNIPVISESAFLHSLLNIGGFQRPF